MSSTPAAYIEGRTTNIAPKAIPSSSTEVEAQGSAGSGIESLSPVPRQTLQGVMAKEGGMAPAVASAETGSGNAVGPKTVSRSFKMFLLAILCLQNAAYTMLRRWSKGVVKEEFSPSSVLLVGEAIKLVVSVFMTLSDSSATSAQGAGVVKLWWLLLASLPMAVPAVVFWMMNLLSYVSISRIDASTFTVCAQMKILTTAVFSMMLMQKRFHARKWRALVLLVLGVTLVSNGSLVTEGGTEEKKEVNLTYFIGVAAVVTEVTLSGFVSVFFEKVLKSRVVNLSVWDRNVQLAMYSIALYLPIALHEEGPILKGWSRYTVMVAILGSAGGLLVAFTTKYTDAVLKTFATSGAILVTTIAGYEFMDAPLDIPIMIGAACTVLSLYNYSDNGDSPTKSSDVSQKNVEMMRGPNGRLDEAAQGLLSRSGSPRHASESV